MKGETDELLRGGSLDTDDRKSKSGSESKVPFPMPVDLLESCLGNKIVSSSDSNDDPNSDKVVTKNTMMMMDALKKAENSSDIQMIDDDVDEEEEEEDDDDDDDEDTGSVIEYETASSSSDNEDSTEIPTVIIEEAEAVVEIKTPPKEEKEIEEIPIKKQLKSVLKKGTERKNKGLRVTFHDTQIFLIDTEVEVSAGPQLLTVRSFDLPLALSDIRVFTPTFDFVPSLPPGSYDNTDRRHYTYEDAIVSFDDYDDVVVCRNAATTAAEVNVIEQDDSENRTDRNVSVNRTDDNDSENRSERFVVNSNSDCPLLAALQKESIQADNEPDDHGNVPTTPKESKAGEKLSESSQSKQTTDETVQSLTEANLKQHEILMEKDILVTEDSVVPVTATPISTATSTTTINTTSKLNSLSPPLKELTVDVQVVPGVEGLTDDWQVELSPLNSIPESETESSTSSQDTIIMMTSDESRRNEEHIQHSMNSFRKQQKQDEGCGNVDADSTGSSHSQDSDDTLKQTDEPQKTSDQIRQILERNADRRNRISYSNIKKKIVDGTPVEKQRQWKSHESLLDTIKKLTLDEVHDTVDGSRTSSESLGPRTTSSESSRRELSKLSPQQVTDLISSPIGVQNLLRARHEASNDVSRSKADVPGDVRQWKIRSSLWNSIGSTNNGFTNQLPTKNTDSTSSLPYINGRSGDGFRESTDQRNGQIGDDTSDELLQFVRQDSERIERIRKRYSYTDGDDYETVGSFARRSSVRGIKPRFGSTNEILKQMQSQLQPPSLSNPLNIGSHMTWPYPNTMTETRSVPPIYQQQTLPLTRYGMRQTSTLPVLQEEIYGTTRTSPSSSSTTTTTKPETQTRIPSYSVRNDYQPVYRTRRGRENCYGNYAQVFGTPGSNLLPPPYQPPPPPPYQPSPPSNLSSQPSNSQPQGLISSNQSSPVKLLPHSKDERGVPEGASSSPKVLFDSMYRHRHPNNSHPVSQYSMPGMVSKDEQCYHQQITDNNGCVYYVMQV